MDLEEILGWASSTIKGAKGQELSARKANLVRWITEMSIKYKKDQKEIINELKKTHSLVKSDI